jgi:hypothetical protein
MKILLSAVVAALFAMAAPASAQLLGRYGVEGRNPDGSTYAGTSTVEKQGDAFRVTWTVDGARFVGTGIGGDEAIAITYRSGNNTGVALLVKEGGQYLLVWTYAGGTALGTEKWTRR